MIRRDFLGAMGGLLVFAPKYGRWFREGWGHTVVAETTGFKQIWHFGAEAWSESFTWDHTSGLWHPTGIKVKRDGVWARRCLDGTWVHI